MTKFTPLLFGASLGLAAATGPALAEIDNLSLQLGSPFPEGVYLSDIDRFVADELTKRSDGKIEVDLNFSNALGSPAEIIPLVGASAVGLGGVVTGYHVGEMPFAGLTNAVPATFESDTVLDITETLYTENETILAEFERLNLKPLVLRHLPQYTLLCTEPVRTMADLKGKKVRSYGAYIPQMLEALGATPVNLSMPEMYESLQRGVVDCVYWTRSLTVPFKLHEVAKYMSDLELGAINAVTLFTSVDNWNSWSPETQALFNEVAQEAKEMSVPMTQEVEDAALKVMRENGVEIVEFEEKEAAMAAIPDMLNLWVEQVSERSPDLAASAEATANQVRELMRDANDS
ncbi:TRAP transporter substrate-binding protein DctP [Sulfitobacter sp. W074]|uniref:TRAP transporter substrate-binding protein DctP n=1 Tax=Sulfitobacter sp. W074 TaxID=2867026 RepID=UPI0021A26EEE|nr:TRAP transporter substrate-binding protein DctP [Sulfitobacter sp. W074]UWR38468.1 TRAP transporter substrate-binding protein DctP [Sulfitobacter sp. W074]